MLAWTSAEKTSMSPSLSISDVVIHRPRVPSVEIVCFAKVGVFGSPLFSYQVILLVSPEAESTSISPSPSKSTVVTDRPSRVSASISIGPVKF